MGDRGDRGLQALGRMSNCERFMKGPLLHELRFLSEYFSLLFILLRLCERNSKCLNRGGLGEAVTKRFEC